MTTEIDDPSLEETEAALVTEALQEALENGAPAEIQAPVEEVEGPPVAVEGEAAVRVVESLLFASPVPLTLQAAREASGLDAGGVKAALEALFERYAEGRCGIVLVEAAGAWQFRTAASSAEAVRRLLKVRAQRLTRAALETLALIAYRQPLTRADVEEVRGVDCGAVIKALLERKLVRILGKKEELGRPLLYGTTKEFLEFFGLKALDQLPTLREFQELNEESRSIVEKEVGEVPQVAGLADLADDALRRKLDEGAKDDDAAIDYLEAAMAEAEARSKLVNEQLDPKPAADGVPQPPSEPPAPERAE